MLEESRAAYDACIALNGENPATLFERARVLTWLGEYELALDDVDRIMAIARQAPRDPTPTAGPTSSPSPSWSPPVPGQTVEVQAGPTRPATTTVPDVPLSPVPVPSQVTSVAGFQPSVTPVAESAPGSVSIGADFITFGGISRAVRNLIYGEPELVAALERAPSSDYSNLRQSGLQPLPSDTPTGRDTIPGVTAIAVAQSPTPGCQCGDGLCVPEAPCSEGPDTCPADCPLPTPTLAQPTSEVLPTATGIATATMMPPTPVAASPAATQPAATATQAPTETPLPTATSTPAPLPSPTSAPALATAPAPTPAATATSWPSVQYPAPLLVAPPDGARFHRRDEIVLEWQSVGQLPEDVYYEVQVLFTPVEDPTQTWKDETPWTKDTRWTLSEHDYLPDLAARGHFAWSVQVVHKTGENAQGRPLGVPLSPLGVARNLIWLPTSTRPQNTPTRPPP
jgi:hypothetical protein